MKTLRLTAAQATVRFLAAQATEIDGRKHFIAATMTDADGTLLSEANGLMVRLLPHQP